MSRMGSPEESRAEGVRIAREMLTEARGLVQGVQVSAPFGKYTAAAEVLETLLPEGRGGRGNDGRGNDGDV